MRLAACALLLLVTRLLQAESDAVTALELPIRFHDGLIWLEVNVPQSDKPLNFLLDTGASVSVLDLNTAQRLGLKLGSQVSVTGVGTTLSGHWPVEMSAKANQIELPGKYLALDLSRLSAACSNSVEGLVGADFLSDQVVQIDYAAQKLRLLAAKPPGENANSIPLEARRCGLRVAVSVNGGKRQWVRLDTGCATALQWVTTAVPPRQCASKLAVAFSELSIPQATTSVSLGRWRVEGVPTGLHREAIFPGECGLLGNELLARFGVVTIDAKNGRLILGPRCVE